MALDTQLQRTIGTVYGEVMRDSGISLPDGRYISSNTFFNCLVDNGIASSAARRKIVRKLQPSVGYGARDNIWTGIQHFFKEPYFRAVYTFNPWKELFRHQFLDGTYEFRPNKTYKIARTNPREAVRIERDLYALFKELPQSMQEEFFGMLESYPCILTRAMDGETKNPEVRPIFPSLNSLVSRIKSATPVEHRDDIENILNVLALHNICVGKGGLISRQIEHLVGYDISTIPTFWEEGRLDDAVIDGKKAELSAFLQKGK